jgi:hypothetical protein
LSTEEQPTSAALSAEEQAQRNSFESVLESSFRRPFYEAGAALKEIRDKKLYRDYGSFEAYCRERWGWSRIHAHRLIEATDARAMLPNGNRPERESQMRALLLLEPEQRQGVWEAAVAASESGDPTVAQIERILEGDQPQSDDESTLCFEVRPQAVVASRRAIYLKKFFSYLDQQPLEARRGLLEAERDVIMTAFQEHLKTLDAPG